jgi:hydrogenase maturation protein HypF
VNQPSRAQVRVRGLVQGVGFRPHVYALAQRLGLTGWVKNDEAGVVLEVQGTRCEDFVSLLRTTAPPLARIDSVEVVPCPTVPLEAAFVIAPSDRHGPASAAIGPDATVCRACVEEMLDPAGHRYRYPFLSCTHCGPRFTITRALPYDRPQTSMASFPMCALCRAEYDAPLDRRFHAQPIACPACGPRLSMPLESIAAALRDGRLVALKGLGGFHLVCDARQAEPVKALRTRKQREAKPLAVMTLNARSAAQFVHLDDASRALLESVARPIVLLEKGPRAAELASELAPDLRHLGVMLPYTPLHVLVFHELLGRPAGTAWLDEPCDVVLVMTSANPGGEPLVIGNDEAHRRLKGLADLVVTHDRDILIRADDSVLRATPDGPRFIRRARGYVPQPIELGRDGPHVLGIGAHLKSTVCFTRGAQAFVSQHLGDVENVAAANFLRETVDHLRRTLEVAPTLVAHDLHPDFSSTRLAQSLGVPTLAVQHHHAHLAAIAAEYRLEGPLTGLALDGFGLGPDGQSWGGELLVVDGARYERLGHLGLLRQPGGDAAARQPWRMAASALHQLGREDEFNARFAQFGDVRALRFMLEKGLRSPWTSSCGRLFDAACGLLGVCPSSRYEGQAPMMLESLVTQPKVLEGAWRVQHGVLDLLPLLDALIGRDPVEGANVFHGTLAAALVDWALPVVRARSSGVVALGGGCLLNEVLAGLLKQQFLKQGVEALVPRRVPANDGGLSLGQAWVALHHVAGD